MRNYFFIFFYLIIFGLLLLIIFFTDIGQYIKPNLDILFKFKEKYFIIFMLAFCVFSILLPFFGFALPVILINGILLDGYLCFFVTLFGITIGSLLFYKIFFKKKFNLKLESYQKKISYLPLKIDNNQFIFFFLLRFVGFGLPFIVHNMLGIFFKIRQLPFFLGTLFGVIPLAFQSILADGLFDYFLKGDFRLKTLVSDYRIILVVFLLLIISVVYFFIVKKFIKRSKNK